MVVFFNMTMTAKYLPAENSIGVYTIMSEDVNSLSDQFSRLSLSDRRNLAPTPVAKTNGFFYGACNVLSMNASGDAAAHISNITKNKTVFANLLCLSPIPKYNKNVKQNIENGIKNKSIENKIPERAPDMNQEPMQKKIINESGDASILKYYAVALPDDVQHPSEPSSLIYSDIKLALVAIKTYKSGRVKEFSTEEAALEFASKPLANIFIEDTIREDESNLKSATCQELCQLRKQIEAGNERSFVETVWKNPKILVGKSDTPSVMHEGIRFNALHVAAKSNKPYICQLILDTIENPKFFKQIYPSETESACKTRMIHVLDLYLNTPDKKTGDTPLHYASKFGCIDCVKVILSHPLCVHDRINIAGLTAKEIVCSRMRSHTDTILEDMEEVFKGMFYVSLLRSESNDVLPVVGKPVLLKDFRDMLCDINKDADSPLILKAFAGPMPPDIAELFYMLLKNPASHIPKNKPEFKLLSKIRFTDREKGLERIGRWLARDLKVQWQEYFSFLDIFTDLSSEDGLEALESYLKDRFFKSAVKPSRGNEEQSLFLVHKYPSHVNPLSHLVNVRLQRENETDDKDEEESFITPPSSPVKAEFLTPPSSPKFFRHFNDDVFLQGSKLTGDDVNVLLAIGELPTLEYPFITKWKQSVESELQTTANNTSHQNSFSLLMSTPIPSIKVNENICTPRKTLLNTGFCLTSNT